MVDSAFKYTKPIIAAFCFNKQERDDAQPSPEIILCLFLLAIV